MRRSTTVALACLVLLPVAYVYAIPDKDHWDMRRRSLPIQSPTTRRPIDTSISAVDEPISLRNVSSQRFTNPNNYYWIPNDGASGDSAFWIAANEKSAAAAILGGALLRLYFKPISTPTFKRAFGLCSKPRVATALAKAAHAVCGKKITAAVGCGVIVGSYSLTTIHRRYPKRSPRWVVGLAVTLTLSMCAFSMLAFEHSPQLFDQALVKLTPVNSNRQRRRRGDKSKRQ